MLNKIKQDKIKGIKRLLFLGVLWFLIGYILLPTARTFVLSLQGDEGVTFGHYKDFFSIQVNWRILLNTLILGLATVGVCGVIGTTLAFVISYFHFPFKKLISKLLLTPVMVPGVIIVMAFIQLYSESGMITQLIQRGLGLENTPFQLSGFWGILFIHAYTQYVYFYMNVSVAIKNIDYSVVEAAKNLGASPWQIFKTIILPFIKPALIASALITFITGIGSFTAPSLIGDGYKVVTTQMLFAKSNNRMDIASVQVVLLTLMAMTFLMICRHYETKSAFKNSIKGMPMPVIYLKNPMIRIVFVVISFVLILFILLPVGTIILLSFVTPGTWLVEIFPTEYSLSNYIRIFTKQRTFEPFLNSILMAGMAVFCATSIGIVCAYIKVKTKIKWKWVIEAMVMLPAAIPVSAIAINLINTFNTKNVFAFNQVLVGSYIILPIAYCIMILPVSFRSTTLSMYRLNETYEEASTGLGANFWQTLINIVLPLVTPGIVSGAALGFIKCVGEYTSSAYLYTIHNKPVSIAMLNGVFEYEVGLAMAYGVLVIVITTVLSFLIYKQP